MKKRRKPMTAGELMAKLEADPDWVAERDRIDAEFEKQAEELRRAQAPLLADLRAVGFAVDTIWNLKKLGVRYPEAIPILLEHLQRPYADNTRDGIARALAVREAKFAYPLLVKLWRAEEPEGEAKQGLASAVAVTGYPEHLDELIAMVRDRSLGPTRGFFFEPLEKANTRQAWAAIMAQGDDPEVAPEVHHLMKRRVRRQQGRRVPRANE